MMLSSTLRFTRTLLLAVVWLSGDGVLAIDAKFRWNIEPDESVSMIGPSGLVWRHNHAPDQSKPYFDLVCLISGEPLTWNAPPDHAWHHGLWFSWKNINGINYWENDPATGVPVGQTSWSDPKIKTTADGSALIEMELLYSPRNEPGVMREIRIVHASPPHEDGQYHFDWDSTFTALRSDVTLECTPIPPYPQGKPWGGYAGLSLRFSKHLVDRLVITELGEASFNQDGIFRSKAMACEYQGTVNNRRAGVAVLSSSDNPRIPTPWYCIRSDMSFMNPAILQHEPYTLRKGKKLSLKYRIIVHCDHFKPKRLKLELANYDKDN